jgi:hypothetical protein
MSNVIICSGVGGWYPKGVERLEQSLKDVGWGGSVLTWKDEYPPGSPPHQANPYAFKLFALEEARRQGFRNVLWCDSSVWATKNPEPVFSIIQNQGYYLWECGYMCNSWTNDATLQAFGISRQEAAVIKMISANIMGFDFEHPTAKAFMDRYRWAFGQGLFKGPWTRQEGDQEPPDYLGHRHDQSSASLIAHELGMNIEGWGVSCQYMEADQSKISATICLTLQGL